jgi:hypothetical protein
MSPTLRSTALLLCLSSPWLSSCSPPLELFVAGFAPENVQVSVTDVGRLTEEQWQESKSSRDIDGRLRVATGSCGDKPCRVAEVSVMVTNRSPSPEAPPVLRLQAPAGRPPRAAVAFGSAEISPFQVGRLRWLVELYPDENALTAVLSSSVYVTVGPPSDNIPASPTASGAQR